MSELNEIFEVAGFGLGQIRLLFRYDWVSLSLVPIIGVHHLPGIHVVA